MHFNMPSATTGPLWFGHNMLTLVNLLSFRIRISTCSFARIPWWRHPMETYSALLHLCEGNPPVTGGFPLTKANDAELWCFFDLHLNKRPSKQSRRRWLETPSRSLWRHYNEKRLHLLNLLVWYRYHVIRHRNQWYFVLGRHIWILLLKWVILG